MDEPIKRGPGRPRKTVEQVYQENREAMTGINDTIRGEDRREPTAQERIDEVKLLEFKGNGFIVPRPAELTMETFRRWMRETAEIGSGDHVALVWQYGNQNKAWRDKLLNEYHAYCRTAGRRWAELLEAALADKQKADAEYQQRSKAANHQRAIAQAEARLAALKAAG